jgi:hypothetical protein
MQKAKSLLVIAGFLFLTAGILTAGLIIQKPTNLKQKAAASTNLSISPATQTLTRGQDITFSVLMNTGNNNVTGFDVELNFDPSSIQISSLKRGSGVAALNNTITNNFNNNSGKVFYSIFTLDKNQAVTGSDIEVLQVKAKVSNTANFGQTIIFFDAASAVSATSESSNALLSSSPGTLTISDTPTATPTPALTPTPTGAPNSCGGTCGSNSNCGSNFFCYQGYCRNPNCSWSDDCSCNATATPTPAPTRTPVISSNITPRPRVTSEPVVVELTPEPEEPDETPNNFWENVFTEQTEPLDPTPSPEPVDLPENQTSNLLPWIIGSLIVAGVTMIFIVIGILKEARRGSAKPPVIKV